MEHLYHQKYIKHKLCPVNQIGSIPVDHNRPLTHALEKWLKFQHGTSHSGKIGVYVQLANGGNQQVLAHVVGLPESVNSLNTDILDVFAKLNIFSVSDAYVRHFIEPQRISYNAPRDRSSTFTITIGRGTDEEIVFNILAIRFARHYQHFIVAQRSRLGSRLLVYYQNRIDHSSVALGFPSPTPLRLSDDILNAILGDMLPIGLIDFDVLRFPRYL